MQTTPASPETARRGLRPRSVTYLAILVLLFGVFNLLRVVDTIREWDFLSPVLLVNPFYLLATGVVWTVASLTLAFALWFGQTWAPRLLWLEMSAYLIWFWLDRLFVSEISWEGSNGPFLIGVSLCLPLLLALYFRKPQIKAYFGEKHERTSEK